MHNIVIKGERTTVLGRQVNSQSYISPKHIYTHIEIKKYIYNIISK